MNTKQLKAKVLDLAIHGKLLSPETVAELKKSPDYETADVLLEKIRKEKEEKIAKGELKRDKKDSYIFVGDDKRHYEKFSDGTVKDIEDEIPFDVPEGWAWCRLGNIVLFERGITFPSSAKQLEKSDNNIPCIRTANVQEELTLDDLIFVDKTFIKNNIKKIVKEDDIIFSSANSRELVGKASYVNKIDIEMTFGGFVLVIRSKINKYVFYFLKREFLFGNFMGESTQTTNIANINTEKLSNILIPVPPQTEQTLIIERIKYWFKIIADFDKNIKNLETLVNLSKSKILDLAIHGKLVPQDVNDEPASVLLEKLRAEKEDKIAKGELKRDKNDSYIYKGSDNCYYQRFADGHEEDISEEIPCELPESWAWCRIKDICKINPKNKLDDNLEVSFIPMTLIDAGYTNHHGQETRVWKKIKTGFTHFAENDVAIAKISPCFENKKSVILKNLKNGYGAGTTELYILRACSIVLPEYLFWIVKTDSFINEGVGNFSGVVGQQRLARDIVENYYIPLPPINEQKRIISKIVSLFEKLDTIENNIE